MSYQSVEDTSAIPDTSVDPSSPHWTDTQIDTAVEAFNQAVTEGGGIKEDYYYIQVTRTIQGVKITHALCFQDLATVLKSAFGVKKVTQYETAFGKDWMNQPSLYDSTLELVPGLPNLPTMTLIPQLKGTDQSEPILGPCHEKFIGTVFEYGGHSGNLWEMLPYLPAPLLPVVKWNWWLMTNYDVHMQAVFEEFASIEAYYEAHPELCKCTVGLYATTCTSNFCPEAVVSGGHDNDKYLSYLRSRYYAAWGYDEEGGQTYDEEHVAASCGGIWLPWKFPFGCAITTQELRSEIWAGGTGGTIVGLGVGATMSLDAGKLIYSANTDLIGRASESTLSWTVFGSIKGARARAVTTTERDPDHSGSTWHIADWFTASPDEAWNTVTGKHYTNMGACGGDMHCISTHPIMNDRAINHAPTGGALLTLTSHRLEPPTIIHFGRDDPVNIGGEKTWVLCDASCQAIFGDYAKQLASQGKLVDAFIFLNNAMTLYGWDVNDARWADISGPGRQDKAGIGPNGMPSAFAVTIWKYFYDQNKIVDLYIRMLQWPPLTSDDKWSSWSVPTSQTRYEAYLHTVRLFTRECGYVRSGRMMMYLRDSAIAQKVRDGTLSYNAIMYGDSQGNLGFGDSLYWGADGKVSIECQAWSGGRTYSEILLSLFGIQSYTDSNGQTYMLIQLKPSQNALLPVGFAGVTDVWLDNWWFLIFAAGIVFFTVGILKRKRRKKY